MTRSTLSARPLALAALLLATLLSAHAQPVPPGPGPGPAAGPGLAPPAPPATYEAALTAQPPVIEGRVTRLLINPYGEADGLLVGERTIIKFPPHLSQTLQNTVKPGQSVRVFGQGEAAGVIKADAIVNLANGQTVIDRPPAFDANPPLPPHLRAAQLRQMSVRGKIALVLTGPRGEANGVILDDGSIVRFAPDSIRTPLEPGAPFAANGLGTRNNLGTAIEAIDVGASTQDLQPLYSRVR
ncbi:hypothetical protein G5B88_23490 [Herbaspirillum seropedicae]|uniref:Secreted protein n=1 Tax=Herbaspirillum seropedicae (strain SmR1) TaxID=757424 RepID=D8IXX2_HERSS|nr:hypothetical protein [Herbaspirillum seropedicae]ADJ66094.1 conserved hypothetical protein [Herbaspirillum seropedicae SmR1]AKN67855.1 hypothetical protein ACP92_23120 [Herbaspirillum seropedicae]NQE29889.1 hypothetical protein [Herbaspirillum seropedicae]UMU23890.1 hypothetical protein G5B88_23490 [Herbaspirillum seropedicae]